MKILTDQPIGIPCPVPKSTAHEKSEGQGFKEILTQTLGTEAPGEMSVSHLKELSGPTRVSLSPVSQMGKVHVLDRVEHIVDLLDEYRAQIENPQATLRDISPLVQAMQDEQQKMEPVLTQLGEDDALGRILKQALFTASMEVMKFNGGGYNDA
jgi:hypothetical protein